MAAEENNGTMIMPIDIQDELKSSFLEYSMSVIVARALPGRARRPQAGAPAHPVRHERVRADARTGRTRSRRGPSARSSASTTRTATPPSTTRWSAWPRTSRCACRSSTDTATSARSTATRRRPCGTPRPGCRRIATELLRDLDKETVDFGPNYDESLEEPLVLPGTLPQPAGQRRRPASRWAWPPTSRRTTSARSSTPSPW